MAYRESFLKQNSLQSSQEILIEDALIGVVEALVEAIEKKDSVTGGHSKRVAHYAVCIAKHLPSGQEISAEAIERIRLSALLHDVGKIGIEDSILKKKASLASDEWPTMRQHPTLGLQILDRIEGLKDVKEGICFHHERWDGKGYPQGLKGEAIPLSARIIAVADTFDAIASRRPYSDRTDPYQAKEEILRHAGTQFCPHVCQAFEQAFHLERMSRAALYRANTEV